MVFVCDICGNQFTRKFNLEKHLNTIHGQELTVNCKYCNINIVKSRLQNHIDSVHKDKKFVCVNCDKKYSYKGDLKKHKCRVSQSYSISILTIISIFY